MLRRNPLVIRCFSKFVVTILVLIINSHAALAQQQAACMNWSKWLQPACYRLRQIWTEGHHELYFTGYAWHNRFTYDRERLKTYNELAWGGGMGQGLFDEKGNWHGLYAMALLDSHKNIEPVAGYAFLKMLPLNEQVKFGIGYSILVTARPDINHNIPFPGVLPWATLSYGQLTLAATYIPGASSAGNVLFLFLKWTL